MRFDGRNSGDETKEGLWERWNGLVGASKVNLDSLAMIGKELSDERGSYTEAASKSIF